MTGTRLISIARFPRIAGDAKFIVLHDGDKVVDTFFLASALVGALRN